MSFKKFYFIFLFIIVHFSKYMIVKILSAARNFEGIDYNERKNDQGRSELLMAGNFDALAHSAEELKKSDYINYMKNVADLNQRVTNKQFHAIISTKGRENSPEELKYIAVEYLDKMGYGKNPFLIYSHSDTENNHVHLVSTRVDKNGKKVNDKFEKIRSQTALQEILRQDPKQEAITAISKALGFNFSTQAQYKLLLELQGFKVIEESDAFKLIKYGKVQQIQSKDDIRVKIENYVSPDERIKQLKAIFYKYKPGLDLLEFKDFVKEKFGIEVLLHHGKGKDKPYGYSIVDNSAKQVLKGSSVMDLAGLLSATTKKEKINKADAVIKSIIEERSTFSGLKNELKKLGFQLDNKGEIKLKGEEKPSIQLETGLVNKLRYNERVGEASKYTTTGSQLEIEVIARLFFVSPNELSLNLSQKGTSGKYHSILQNIIDSNKASDVLDSLGIKVVKYEGNYFLVNGAEKEVTIIDQGKIRNLSLEDLESVDLENGRVMIDNINYTGKGILGQVLEMLAWQDYSAPEEKKKKRRHSI